MKDACLLYATTPSMGALQTFSYTWYPLTTAKRGMQHFCVAHDDKINACGFVFSTTQRLDDSLQFAKVFPRQTLKVTNLPKFNPTTVLCYMVYK